MNILHLLILLYRFEEVFEIVAKHITLESDGFLLKKRTFSVAIKELLITSTPLSGYTLTFGNASGSVAIPQSAFIGLKTDYVRVVRSTLHRPALFSGSQENISVFTDVLSISFLNTTVQELKEPIVIILQKPMV